MGQKHCFLSAYFMRLDPDRCLARSKLELYRLGCLPWHSDLFIRHV